MNCEPYSLVRTTKYPLSFVIILFILLLSYYLIFLTIPNLFPQYKTLFLPIQFLINLTFIWLSIRAISNNARNNIFSKIKVTLNLQNKDIYFSQKKEILKKNPDGFNFYATLTVQNNNINNIEKIKKDLNNKIYNIFNNFLHDPNYDNIMAKEHWYRIAFATFLYFIYLVILIETIGVGKKVFEIYQHESFLIIVFFTILYLSINKYHKLTKYEKTIILTFIMGILILSFIEKVKFNQNYSVILIFISLMILIYITYLPISLIQPNTKNKNIKKNKLDKNFLIDIYFNRTFLYYYDTNKNLEAPRGMKKEIFYVLIGLLFSLSVPIIINEVKTPTVLIEK